MKKNFIWGLLLAACLFSCQNKYEHLDEFKEFVEKIEDECDDYTLNDWEKADKEFPDLPVMPRTGWRSCRWKSA